MQAAVIENSAVVNIIEIESLDLIPALELVDATGAQIGDLWDGGQFITPAAPNVPETPPDVPHYVAAVQLMLDAKAKERRYDSILSACTYATSTQPKFQAEGQACVVWRDAVWACCYDLMDQVHTGQIPQPTVDELVAMLPAMEWPQ